MGPLMPHTLGLTWVLIDNYGSMVTGVPVTEKLFVGGDLNGHMGTTNVLGGT
jgi:hypothetical protein